MRRIPMKKRRVAEKREEERRVQIEERSSGGSESEIEKERKRKSKSDSCTHSHTDVIGIIQSVETIRLDRLDGSKASTNPHRQRSRGGEIWLGRRRHYQAETEKTREAGESLS